jgi:hypothetical protein
VSGDNVRWRTLDDEGVCTRCGSPDVHCFCPDLTTNEYGTVVSFHRCSACGGEFTVCPPAGPLFGSDCLADTCSSYDISRDVDMFFEPAYEAGIIRRAEEAAGE